MIVRIQDKQGRGPWRPGFSHTWLDPDGPALPPAIQETVKNFSEIVNKAHSKGFHIGCAVRDGRISDWVSDSEMDRLKREGFFLVNATQCQILADDGRQVLIACKKPLRKLPKVGA